MDKKLLSLADISLGDLERLLAPQQWDLQSLGSPAAAYFTGDDPAYQAAQLEAQRPIRAAEAFGKNAYGTNFQKMLAAMARK